MFTTGTLHRRTIDEGERGAATPLSHKPRLGCLPLTRVFVLALHGFCTVMDGFFAADLACVFASTDPLTAFRMICINTLHAWFFWVCNEPDH